MKRIVCIMTAALALALALASCSELQSPPVPQEIEIEVLPTPEAAPVSVPEIVPSPSPTPDLLLAQGGAYTIAWISDTQHYSKNWPEIYYRMTEFLRDNAARLNLKYVIHTGDLVHNYDDDDQWDVAVKAQSNLDGIPNGVLAGNHDVDGSRLNFENYSRHFGRRAMEDRPYYGGSYDDNRGHYDLLDIGKTPYIFIYMSYLPDSSALRFMRKTLEAHPERVAILCFHDYFDTDMSRGDTGEAAFKKLVSKYPNVYMVLCGHRYNIGMEISAFDDDGDGEKERTAYEMLCNYQAIGEFGGNGYMRLMRVDERAGTITAFAYSPYMDDFVYFDNPGSQNEKYPADPENEEFVIDIPWM